FHLLLLSMVTAKLLLRFYRLVAFLLSPLFGLALPFAPSTVMLLPQFPSVPRVPPRHPVFQANFHPEDLLQELPVFPPLVSGSSYPLSIWAGLVVARRIQVRLHFLVLLA